MMISALQAGQAFGATGLAAAPQPATTGAIHESANPHEVRDPARAQYFQDLIRSEVLSRFPDLESVIAAGYVPTRTDIDGPVHYTLGGYTNPDPNQPDGGVSDFSRPFSIMVEDGKVTGVMLRAPEGEVDLGAGEWHGHGEEAGGTPLMHVWFDKPLDQAFGGHVPGFMPNEPMPEPTPKPGPDPAPKPTPPAPHPHPHPHPEPMPKPPVPTPMPMPMPKPKPNPPVPAPMPMPMPSPVPPPPPGGQGCCHSHGAHPTQFPLG